MRKIIVIFLVFLTLFTTFTICASGGFKVWPGKLDYTINWWPTDEDKTRYARIQVTNTESHDIDLTVRIDHPHVNVLDAGYSQIPDLSWVKSNTDVLHIPAKSSEYVEVNVEVPKSEQSLHYNEKWETYVVISSPLETEGGINFKEELAVKLFIKTPSGEKAEFPYIFIIIIFFLPIILYLIHSYIKKKRDKFASYYFKKKN